MKKVKKYADAGDVTADDQDVADVENESALETDSVQDDTSPQAAPSAPQTAPAAADPSIAPPPTPTPPPTAQSRDQQDLAHMQDAATRQITPKTYASMFADKSTLGKIGTLFGMMLSGAGSGLAHQSNAALDMMNNQIRNDLDSQKSNVSNAQNFLTLSYAHELQKAQIANYGAQTALTGTQMGVAPAQIAASQAQTGLYQAQTKNVPLEGALLAAQTDAATKAALASQAQTDYNKVQTQDAKIKLEVANQAAAMARFKMQVLSGQPSSGSQAPTTPNGAMPPSTGGGTSSDSTNPMMPTQGSSDSNMTPMPPPPINSQDLKQASIAAPYRAENGMRIAATQYLGDISANNPQAQAMLQNVVIPGVMGMNQQTNQKLAEAQQAEHQKAMSLYQDPVTDQNKLQTMISNGQMFASDREMIGALNRPGQQGAIPEGEAESIKTDQMKLKDILNKRARWAQNFQAIAQLSGGNAGQISPALDIAGAALGPIGTAVGAGLAALSSAGAGTLAGGAAGNVVGNAGKGGIAAAKEYYERDRNILMGQFKEMGIDPNTIFPSRADQGSYERAWNEGEKFFAGQYNKEGGTLQKYGLKAPYQPIPFDQNSYMNQPMAKKRGTPSEEKLNRALIEANRDNFAQ